MAPAAAERLRSAAETKGTVRRKRLEHNAFDAVPDVAAPTTTTLAWPENRRKLNEDPFQDEAIHGVGRRILRAALSEKPVAPCPDKRMTVGHRHFVFPTFRQSHGGVGCLSCQRPR